MRMAYVALFSVALCVAASAQTAQQNTITSALNVNDTALNAIFTPAPITRNLFTDSPLTVNLRGAANTPAVIIWAGSTNSSSFSAATFTGDGVQIDIDDQGTPGYGDQTIVNGYEAPWPTSFLDATGNLSISTNFPSCTTASGATNCISNPSFDISIQGIVVDTANPPFNISSTGAVIGAFTNGYQEFNFNGAGDDQFSLYNFKDNFTFTYWGVNYSQVYVSENSYIQFGTTQSLGTFAGPSVGVVMGGGPRIMSFFNDLDPDATSNDVVFVQQFVENGVKKARFVHEQIAEFGNATGGHGGEITITENGEIAVLVGGYNAAPSINTAVGISRGTGQSSGTLPSTVFGRDLSASVQAINPVVLGNDVPAFELFDHGNSGAGTVQNPLDLAGFNEFNGTGVGPGVVFLPDPSLNPPQSGYIIQ